MHNTAAEKSSMGNLGPRGGAVVRALAFVFLGASLGACADDKPAVRPTPSRARPSKPVQVDTPTVENAEDRAEEIRRVCNRKASSELPRCWSEEFDRTKNKKFVGNVNVMLTISPSGEAQDVEVLNPKPELKEFEKCVADAARSWTYPSGQTVAPVQCDFFLQSSM
jgi:hypothetical protein